MRIKMVSMAILAMAINSGAVAQDSSAAPGIYKSNAEILAELNNAASPSASAAGSAVTIAPGISVRRRSSSVAQFAIVHLFSIEIYRILEGSGTFVSGGTLKLPLADSPNPDIIRTEHGIQGGLARQVAAGDIIVLQPGTPHWFSVIDGDSITYMESRIQVIAQ